MQISAKIFQHGPEKISYRELGEGKRKVLFFHGFPGSSGQIHIFQKYLDHFDLHVLCVDRPGYNASGPSHMGQSTQFNHNLASLLALLKWKDFELITVSGGTPFLFSFLRSYSTKAVSNVSIICGLGAIGLVNFKKVMGKKSLLALKSFPHIPQSFFKKIFKHKTDQSKVFQQKIVRFFLPISAPDMTVLKDVSIQASLMNSLYEAFSQNGIGPKADAVEYFKHNDLTMGSYKGPIQIWHGKQDRVISYKTAELTHKQLSNSTLYLIEEEGHYSLPILRLSDILEKATLVKEHSQL